MRVDCAEGVEDLDGALLDFAAEEAEEARMKAHDMWSLENEATPAPPPDTLLSYHCVAPSLPTSGTRCVVQRKDGGIGSVTKFPKVFGNEPPPR